MTTIMHLSDLHFGTDVTTLCELVIAEAALINPDMIIVSGDLTQRARHSQYRQAQTFLDALKSQHILCVPGNHDISLYNPLERFIYPFRKYTNYISSLRCDRFSNDEIAVIGINSVTPYKAMSGYVTATQIQSVKDYFATIPANIFKIVVMHHNLIKSERHKTINDAENLITKLSLSNVNLILCGHIHAPHVEQLRRDYFSHNMYVLTAGTAVSTRTTLPNSFNVVEVSDKLIKINVKDFDGSWFNTSKQIELMR